eukprot:TRINITY_DN1014_c0_g1_i2.p1 TRINITY_DN1014_c0_g1~~TRINITY_DN1014_c0_g1_i2.p1  ORF type:complete len:274 (-),score=96.31 TRINITY_DN1014_c0_g1_i2:278-1099(-)
MRLCHVLSSSLALFLFLGGSPVFSREESSSSPPTPSPPLPKWTFENCLILSFNSSNFHLHPSLNSTLNVSIPSNASVVKDQSHCGNETQVLMLSWDWLNANGTSLKQNVTLEFGKNNNTKSYAIKDLYGTFYIGKWNESKTVDNKTENITVFSYIYMELPKHSKPLLPTPLNRSYVCVDPGNLTLSSQLKISSSAKFSQLNNTILSTVGLKFDAFRDSKRTPGLYQNPFNCIENRVNDIVPIIVGCVLAFLIAFVLVAYVIGRRRPRSGYIGV